MLNLKINNYCCKNNWKAFPQNRNNDNKIKLINITGSFRPLHNLKVGKYYSTPNDVAFNELSESLSISNVFKARPIKHWRKQSGNYDNRQSYTNRTLIKDINTPGGTSMYTKNITSSANNCCTPDDTKCNHDFGNLAAYPSYQLNLTNKTGSASLTKNNKDLVLDRNTCLYIPTCKVYDIPRQAKRRVQFNNNTLRTRCSNSFHSYNEFKRARCMTYDQNLSIASSCPYGCNKKCITKDNNKCRECHCGCPTLDEITKYNNDPNKMNPNTRQLLNATSTICKNRAVIKRSNPTFWKQGSVSSSNRIAKLRADTVNKNANSVGKEYGCQAATALNYSGRPETPFINKCKMNASGFALLPGQVFPTDQSIYYKYKVDKKLNNGQNICSSKCSRV